MSNQPTSLAGGKLYIIAKTSASAITAYANRWREQVRSASTAKAVGTIELITAMKEVAS